MLRDKILIIDDDPAMLAQVRSILQKETYEIQTAENGEEGMTLCQSFQPAVTLLDLKMPGMGGMGFLQRLQRRHLIRNNAIIILSGRLTPVLRKLCFKLGVHEFIEKPFEIHELRRIVTHCLQKQATAHLGNIAIPSPPETLIHIMREIEKPDSNFDRIISLLHEDASLTARAIKVINSPFFGLRAKVTDLAHALAMLGIHKFKKFVVFSALKQAVGSDRPFHHTLWKHIFNVATLLSELAEWVDAPRDHAYLFGLFYDVGALLIAKSHHEYEALFSTHITETEERQRYAITHAEVGEMAGRSWHLPDMINQAIRFHEMKDYQQISDTTIRTLAGLRWVAEYLASVHDLSSDPEQTSQQQTSQQLFQQRQLSRSFAERVWADLSPKEHRSIDALLTVHVGSSPHSQH